VKIVGDSHLRGTAARIDQYLNTKFEVCSRFKLGANIEELVDTLEKDFKCLGKKDVIVINRGANDIGSKRKQISGVLVKMTQFMQKYNNNNNVIVVNIPHRHDVDMNSETNLEIQTFNRNLHKRAKAFSHVALVETEFNRKYFIQHGMHLNKSGKEWLSKLIATQISRLVKRNNRDVPVIALNWKDESKDKQNTVNVHTKSMILPDLNNSRQSDETHKEIVVCRTSNTLKKLPVTRNNDFLWKQ
jgi:hypothetical protein